MRQQAAAGPRDYEILTERKTALREVDRDARGADGKRTANVLLALADEILLELLTWVPGDLLVERIQAVRASTGR